MDFPERHFYNKKFIMREKWQNFGTHMENRERGILARDPFKVQIILTKQQE
jgi:hypothetical protein